MTVTSGSIRTLLEDIEPAPMRLTRKSDASQFFLTGWRAHGDGVSHTVRAEWPRTHGHYTSDPGHYHPLLFAETIRQALALLSHTAYDIPLDHRLGWESFDASLSATALAAQPAPSTVELVVTHTEAARRRGGSTELAAQIMATVDGRPLGIARVRHIAHPPNIYDRLRGSHADARTATARALPLGPALDAALRGPQTPRANAVLSPGDEPRQWLLRVDVANRTFFDHPHDHVPGLLFLEAAAQAVHALSPARHTVPTRFDATFLRYVELDAPCRVEAAPLRRRREGIVTTRVVGRQSGHEVFSVDVTASERD